MRVVKPKSSPRLWMTGLAAALALLTIRCAIPTNPGLPSWDIPMMIPFSEQRYGLDSLVSRPGEIDSIGSGIDLIEGNTLRFIYRDDIPYQQVDQEDLRFQPELEHTFITPTDTLVIDPSEIREAGIGMRQIVSGIPWNDGDMVDLQDGTIPTDAQEVSFSNFDSMAVVHVVEPNGGGMNLTLRNNTDIVWDEITVTITLNEPGRPVLDMLTWSNFQPDAVQTQFADLSGDSLKASVLLIVDGNWSAQNGVQLFEGDGLEFTLEVLELRVDWAEAIVNKQEPRTSSSVNSLNQDDWIERAVINDGALIFEVENQTDVRDSIYIVFPNFLETETGDTLRRAFEVGRSADPDIPNISSFTIPLTGYELSLPLPSSEDEVQGFEARTTVVVLSSRDSDGNPRFARVTARDSVITRFYTTELNFDSFSGLAKDISIDVDEQVQELDIFREQPDIQNDLAGSFFIERARMNFEMQNGFDFPMRLILNFFAENEQKDTTLTREYSIDIDASQDTFSIDNVEDLINILPNRITFTTAVRMGRDHFPQVPPYESRSLALGDSLQGLLSIVSPFMLKITETTAVRPAPVPMRKKFDQPITRVQLITRVTNTVPLGGTIFLMAGAFEPTGTETALEVARRELTRANYHLYGLMTPLPVNVAPVDSETGRVIEPMLDSTITEIPGEAIDIFNQDNVFVRQVLVLNPTLGEDGLTTYTVAMNEEDYIGVTVLGEVTYRVNEQTEGGE